MTIESPADHRDAEDTLPSTRVIETVAAELHADPTTLEPIYYTVDLDLLDVLFLTQAPSTNLSIRFRYEGHVVTVRCRDPTERADPVEVRVEAD